MPAGRASAPAREGPQAQPTGGDPGRARAPAREVLLVLRAEAAAGYDDSAAPGGLSHWIAAHDRGAGEFGQLAQYSRLRPRTREQLARGVMERLAPKLPKPSEPSKPLEPPKPSEPPEAQRPTYAEARRASPGAGAAPKPAARRSGAATGPPPLAPRSVDAPVSDLPGVGGAAVKRLAALDIQTVDDLLRHRPRRYIDRASVVAIADLEPGREVTVIGNVAEIRARQSVSGRVRVIEAAIADASGAQILAVWFNQPYLAGALRGRRNVAFAGRVETGAHGLQFVSPEYELDLGRMIHAGRLVPVYPLTRGLTQRQLRRWMAAAVDDYAAAVSETLPDELRGAHRLLAAAAAVRNLHFPVDAQAAAAAARRFAFAELLVFQLAVLQHRRTWRESQPGRAVEFRRDALAAFGARLPFTLTDDQRTSAAEILSDLRRDRPMSRLLQGDVGSGKTVVAAGALYAVVDAGWQGAMMAPTEVLAEQHAETLRGLLQPLGVRVELITGGVPAAEKRKRWRGVERGEVHVVVGTHAIIQRSARFARLNLAVVDEQHRFGVRQRGEIRAKGYNPHLLAMSATPIPRSLALTIYGDLDVSVIRQLPRGRKPIHTSFVPRNRRSDAYAFIRREVDAGRQAFIVFPLVEESEALNARAAVAEHARLTRTVFADLADAVGLLHGRMSTADKERAMRAFRDGELRLLVSTAVVEVGVDVPNATVILIEGAERFGLAQLHQLRGRVGRGRCRSYCLLMSQTTDPDENARLRTLQTVRDGFALAERDLELRGPGDVIGTRQSGALGFRFASVTDLPTIQAARAAAQALTRADPQLERPEHAPLAAEVERLLIRNEWN